KMLRIAMLLASCLACAHSGTPTQDSGACVDPNSAVRVAHLALSDATKGKGVEADFREGSIVEHATKWAFLVAFEGGAVPTLAFLSVRKTDCGTGWELAARCE